MKRVMLAGFAALLCLGLADRAAAQEQSAPQMLWVYQEHVKPPMMQEYEAATNDLIELIASSPKAAASIEFATIAGLEVGYVYVIPVEGFGGMDAAWQSWEAMIEEVGREQYMQIQSRASQAIDYSESQLLMLRSDLSYMPENTALTAERPYRVYHFYYAIPGMESGLEGIAKEYVKLYESKGIKTGWRVYQAVLGADLPLYIVVESATDPAAFHAREAKIQKKLGEEGQQLAAKSLKFARRVEMQDGWLRPDLSFPRPQGSATKE